MADDLDGLVRRVDPDRWLASRFIEDHAKRADVISLYAYDHELARAPKVASNPLIAEIRLTWWREVLDEIYGCGSLRAHPTALALNAAVRRRALPRDRLEAMIDARVEALGRPQPNLAQAEAWAANVGGSATALASLVLDPETPARMTEQAGLAWGLLKLRRAGGAVNGLDVSLLRAFQAAKTESRKLSSAAFPAIAAVTVTRGELAGRPSSALGRRLRLLAAVARGSI